MAVMQDTMNRVNDTVQSARDTMHSVKDKVGRMGSEIIRQDQSEGPVARSIEQQTAKLPSDMFLWAALGCMGLSLGLDVAGQEKKASFVGLCAPTFLILGLYNKMVKLHGSDGEKQHHDHHEFSSYRGGSYGDNHSRELG